MNRSYIRGRGREYRVIYRLRRMGALWTVRSYGSHGIFDVTAVFPDRVLLIQVKGKKIGREELEGLKEFASKIRSEDIQVQVWQYVGRKREVIDLQTGSGKRTR